MKKSIVRKVFLTTMGLLLFSLILQFVIQIYFIDDIYYWLKSREMEKHFQGFLEKVNEENIDSLSEDYFLSVQAPIMILDENNQLLNPSFFNAFDYVVLEDDETQYKLLLGDRVDEKGVLLPPFEKFDKGNELSIMGLQLNNSNIISLEGDVNSPMIESLIRVEGKIIETHFMEKNMGIYSRQSEKLLREVMFYLEEDPLFYHSDTAEDFFESETGLVLTLQKSVQPNGIKIFSLYTLEDLSRTFTVLNDYYLYIFVVQILLLMFLTLKYSKWITLPLRQLITSAKKISLLDFSEQPVVKTGDELEVLSLSLKDISMNMAENLDRLQQEAREKEENEARMRALLANLSHEFKTPLGIMSGFVEMMSVSEENKKYYLETLEGEIDRVNTLTKETLLLCESEHPIAYHLDDVHWVSELLETEKFKHKMAENHIKLDVNYNDQLVYCDALKIKVVVDNLLSNAIKYTPAHENIEVAVRDVGEEVLFKVTNSGVVLSEEELKRIWQKYYRTEGSRNKAYGGNGLGLSIVANILKHHKSDFGAYNSDEGLTVHFTLKKVMG